MAKRKRKKKTPDELNTENELMKLKLMAEFGGDFVGGDTIPPEVENQFLKQIVNFHKQHDKSPLTTVYKFIGEPEYNHVHDLSDKEVESELKRLLKLMDKKGIGLSVLPQTPAREVYRFVTEELFKHEIEAIRVKGWTNQFVYEEFYPNKEYDIRNVIDYCVQFIFNKESLFFEDYYSEEMKNSIGLTIDAGEFEEKVKDFHEQFHNIKPDKYIVTKIEMDEEAGTAQAVCEVNYKTQTAKGKRYKPETTTLEFYLIQNKDMNSWWEINRVVSELF